MRGILKEFHPFLIVEVVHAAYCKSIQDYLVSLGYEFFGVSDTLLIPISTLSPHPAEEYRNVLCVARCKAKLFTRLGKNQQMSILPS